jgi:signal transduction histidine kinase
LTNCVRHAKARAIAVRITATAGQLTIAVTDDGAGFDQQAAHTGLGLRGIEERVKEIGGTLTITSAPGRGTSLVIQLPQSPTTNTEVRLARVAG